MFSGELEVQARRKTLSVLQDEARRVLDSARVLSEACSGYIRGDDTALKRAFAETSKVEEDVTSMRRVLMRDLAEIGTMMMNREDVLRVAYNIADIAAYVDGVAFRLSQINSSVLKEKGIGEGLKDLVDSAVEGVHRVNEMVRALTINPNTAMELASTVQKIEKEVDGKQRAMAVKVLEEVGDIKDMILLKEIVERVEEMADTCLHASDSITILALGL